MSKRKFMSDCKTKPRYLVSLLITKEETVSEQSGHEDIDDSFNNELNIKIEETDIKAECVNENWNESLDTCDFLENTKGTV